MQWTNKNMKLSIPLESLINTDNKKMCCHCPLKSTIQILNKHIIVNTGFCICLAKPQSMFETIYHVRPLTPLQVNL